MFTEGTWTFEPDTGEITADGAKICKVYDEGNAKLIAAAPDLLKMSSKVLAYAYKHCAAVEAPYKFAVRAVIDEAEQLFQHILGGEQ